MIEADTNGTLYMSETLVIKGRYIMLLSIPDTIKSNKIPDCWKNPERVKLKSIKERFLFPLKDAAYYVY